MRVFITGAAGFIGSHVVEALLQAGHHVDALARYNSRADRGHLSDLDPRLAENLTLHFGDVRDSEQMSSLVAQADVVLHLAALIGIPYSYEAPETYVDTNILGTLNILQACRRHKTQRVVITSTSEVYGTAQTTPMTELHPLHAQSPYAASKIGADKLGESFYASFGLPVVTLRPFNTYGPRQSARAIIPTVLTQALRGAKTIELGNLEPQRDLTFVEDTAHAFLLAATTPGIEGETIHFGQGQAIRIGDLAQKCLDVVGSTAEIISTAQRQRPDNSEVGLLLCDAAKAQRVLGWKPTASLDQGLEKTAHYLSTRLDVYPAGGYVR